MILIKKYKNRKLYDTSQQKYVSLKDINELVRKRQDFEVIENSTKTNITKEVAFKSLLENISDKEFKKIISFLGDWFIYNTWHVAYNLV